MSNADTAQQPPSNSNSTDADTDNSVARLSSAWENDGSFENCHECTAKFHKLNRRHHCRMCGKIFCNHCSSRRALVPPSCIVLVPKGSNSSNDNERRQQQQQRRPLGFLPEEDPDRMLTFTNANGPDTLLYGRGLEERYKLAREPLRVCDLCHEQLKCVQEELRASNSNAVRYNNIDPTDNRRLFNSPLAFTLGHEIRKAAYTLNNLLPLPKRSSMFLSTSAPSNRDGTLRYHNTSSPYAECKNTCSTVSPTLGDLDGVRIPARLMEEARGIATMTVFKGGFGVGVEFGTGLVVARLDNNDDDSAGGTEWSAPSAIGTVGMSWGALAGAQVSDHVFLLMTDKAVDLMSTDEGSFQLGADIGVAIGPLGRTLEADVGLAVKGGAGKPAFAPIYTYSLSKGLYAGVSFDGKVVKTRHWVNEKFYGQRIEAAALLGGKVATPPAARPLYDALKRCHVYATNNAVAGGVAGRIGEEIGCFPEKRKIPVGGVDGFSNSVPTDNATVERSDNDFYYRDENADDFTDVNVGQMFAGGTAVPPQTPAPATDRTYTMPSDFKR